MNSARLRLNSLPSTASLLSPTIQKSKSVPVILHCSAISKSNGGRYPSSWHRENAWIEFLLGSSTSHKISMCRLPMTHAFGTRLQLRSISSNIHGQLSPKVSESTKLTWGYQVPSSELQPTRNLLPICYPVSKISATTSSSSWQSWNMPIMRVLAIRSTAFSQLAVDTARQRI